MDQKKLTILKHCRSPKTYEELATLLDAGYYSVRGVVQELIAAGVVEELPFCRRGTRQKQFQTKAFSEADMYTREGCAEIPLNGKQYTAYEIIAGSDGARKDLHDAIEILFSSLSAPLSEVISGELAGFPHSSVVAERLPGVRHLLVIALDLCEYLIYADCWGDEAAARTLFHVPPEKMNKEVVLKVKARLNAVAEERGW